MQTREKCRETTLRRSSKVEETMGKHRLRKRSSRRAQVLEQATDDEYDGEIIRVDSANLKRLNVRPGFFAYLAQLWERRFFVLADARFRAFRTAKSYNLWRFWIIAQPLLEAAMYGVIFGLLLKTSRGIDNYLGFLVLGVTFFGLMSALLNGGQSLLQTSRNLMQTFQFPRASLVLSQSLRYMLDNLPGLIIAIAFALGAQWGTPLSWKIVLVIPLILMIWIFGTGLMFIVARLTAFIPDVKVLINLGLRAWFFSSGIFFSLERFADNPTLYRMFCYNPAYLFLKSVRETVIYDTIPSAETWGYLAAWSFGAFFIGLLFFWRAEERYIHVK